MSRKFRVAIYGGDERTERLEWPDHLDVRVYPYKSPRSLERLRESASSGTLDHVVLLTSYMGHAAESAVRNMGGVSYTRWPRSPGELARQIGTMFRAPVEVVNPLLRPTKPDDPGTGGGRGPLPTKQEIELTAEPPKFEHVVTPGPREDETLGQALRRILVAERMTQAELGRLLNRPQPTVSAWMRDTARPRDMGPLVDLWPELAKFDLEHEHKEPPTAKPTEDAVKRELLDLIRSVRVETQPVPVVSRLMDAHARWKLALKRFREAKAELEAAEQALLEAT